MLCPVETRGKSPFVKICLRKGIGRVDRRNSNSFLVDVVGEGYLSSKHFLGKIMIGIEIAVCFFPFPRSITNHYPSRD
jgi:hypothetical protein